MPEILPKENAENNGELSRQQRTLAIRALETIGTRIEELHTRFSEKEVAMYTKQLFQLPSIKELLEERGISEEDEPEEIQRKLKELLISLQEENERQVFYPEEPPRPEIDSVVPESAREEMMNIQDEINTLIQKRDENYDYVEEERPKIEEALGQLALFGSDINPHEKVEVARTESGAVEVIFERDVEEGEALQAIRTDIRLSRERITKYESSIAKKKQEGQKGFLQKIFTQKKGALDASEPDPLDACTLEELEGKKARTEQALLDVMQDYEAREAELQKRLQQKKQALDVPLMITALHTFVGSWNDLSTLLKNGCEQFLRELEESMSQYDERISALEAKRDRTEKTAA